MERIKQLFFTYSIIEDIIKEAKQYGNPNTFFVFFYHFSYFVSLVKTIGDNLAWMLKFYLDLNINHFLRCNDINIITVEVRKRNPNQYLPIPAAVDILQSVRPLTNLL